MVVFLHKGFHESQWCDQEVGFARARRIPILPITIDERPYGFISKYQALDGHDLGAGTIANRITYLLSIAPSLRTIMTECLVSALEDSSAEDLSTRLVALLLQRRDFTLEQLDRLDQAAKTNDHVIEARLGDLPVPMVIEVIVTSHRDQLKPAAT
jgi:hypothetical protein